MKRGQDRKKPFYGKEKRDEYQDKVIDLRRVTRVTGGGKRFRFRATVIVGDQKGKVGVGLGKGTDVQQTIAKARADAKKNIILVPLEDRTIPHEVSAKFSAARVQLKPARVGHGLIAGGSVRSVLNLLGVKDITAKCIGSTTNKLTNARATIKALQTLQKSKKR
jgi:small subunit ribosomal protein S5